jgi:hypothetical protein
MPDHEQDVQTCLTYAIPRYAEHLGDLTKKFVEYVAKTPPNSEQPTDLPRGLGVDVLAILGARRVLALEVKKVDHETQRLGKVEDAQVAFLQRLEKNALFESYIVFDRLPDLRFKAVESYPARSLAQLNAIAAVRPNVIDSAKKDIAKLIGPKANGLTMLDVITRVMCELPESDPDIANLFALLTKNLSAMNNCILWFFGDGYVADLSLEQAQAALVELIQLKGTEGSKRYPSTV